MKISSPLPTSLLAVALRAYALQPDVEVKPTSRRQSQKKDSKPAPKTWHPPHLVLVLDTETRTDRTLHLLFGASRVLLKNQTVDEALLAADDLPDRDQETLAAYARTHSADTIKKSKEPLRLLSRRAFLKAIFWPIAYKGRGLVVCFNFPFDHSRIASSYGIARTPPYTGGVSLILSDYLGKDGRWHENRYRPRIDIKSIDSKRALKGFSRPHGQDWQDQIPEGSLGGQPDPSYRFRGHLLDLRTLAFALTNTSHSLESACRAFGIEGGKDKAKEMGNVTPEQIQYCRRDVELTTQLYLKLTEEYCRHPISLPITQAYSPASITKAYFKAMGIQPILQRQPDFLKWVLGAGMEAYFGGRAECRIRQTVVPVVYLDFLSMYPTVCALMRLWRLFIAKRIEVVEATGAVERMLAGLSLEQCFQRAFWPQLVGLVQIQPEDDILPVRARYEGTHSWQIGINPYTSSEPEWRTIADVVDATLLTGRPPKVLRAIRLVPVGIQPDLQPIRLRGTVPFDPRTQDFFCAIIEERKGLDRRAGLSSEEHERLDAFFKVLANSIYGINAEMNRQDLLAGETVTVDVYTGRAAPFTTSVRGPEQPGEFCFPPIAACIAGAARLMLGLLERYVTDAGGSYASCDTDSMTVVSTEAGDLVPCPGGPEQVRGNNPAVRALKWAQVDAIRERFAALNPYDRTMVPGSILKLEKENRAEDGNQQQLWAYAISAKRYALLTKNAADRPDLCKASEHGLGHLLNPTDPDDESRDWIRELWEGTITEQLGLEYTWPAWLDRQALSRISISSPGYLKPFAKLNDGKPYAEQVKPFNFLLSAQVDPFALPAGVDPEHFHLIAPYESDPRKWQKLQWVDRYCGTSYRITTSEEAALYGGNMVQVKTYREVLAEYRTHPEAKSLGPDGEVCSRQSIGLLQRRPVARGNLTYTGKESNKLEEVEAGMVHDPEEVYTEYADPGEDTWQIQVVPILRLMSRRQLAELTGLSQRQLAAIRNGHALPHPASRDLLRRAASDYAQTQLQVAASAAPYGT